MKIMHYMLTWCLAGIALTCTLYFLSGIYHQNSDQTAIEKLQSGKAISSSDIEQRSVSLKLAYASFLRKHQRYDEALRILDELLKKGSPDQQMAAFYNLGNLYLYRAMDAITQTRFDDATAFTGLAKNAYRRSLGINSHFWDGKYNLDVAMRLMPELERRNVNDETETNKKAKPWTTIPGFPRGLP